jgi:ATP-dependent RNA helicase DHX29
MNHILDIIQAENRFAASSISSDAPASGKMLPEEDVIARLWTLQQTLEGVGFPSDRAQAVSQFILDISSTISVSNKDMIWGLEEALEWLARECPAEELPSYEPKVKATIKGWRPDHLPSGFLLMRYRYTGW